MDLKGTGVVDDNGSLGDKARILKLIKFRKDRVYRKKIMEATVRNYVKNIKLFYEHFYPMS